MNLSVYLSYQLIHLYIFIYLSINRSITGNVALDCARILAREPIELASTDISHVAYDELCSSQIETITLIGKKNAS